MAELVGDLAELLVASGICDGHYSDEGRSAQVNFRRETHAETIVLLTQRGGLVERERAEMPSFQVLVDSSSIRAASTCAREVFDFLHEMGRFVSDSGHDVLWVRAVAPPQAVPNGPGESERFQFSMNFDAFIRKAGSH